MRRINLIILIFCISNIGIAQTPIAEYPFSGNSSDISGNGNDGIVHGATLTTDRFGNPNSAYLFNGTSDYIDIPNSAVLSFVDSFSVSVWFELLGNTGNSRRVLDKGIANFNYGFVLSAEQTGYSFTCGSINGLSNPLQLGQWYHAVAVFEGGNTTLYLNGQFDSFYLGSSPMIITPSDLIIGAANPLGYFFNGKIDDIKIFDTALTSGNVNALFMAPNPTSINEINNQKDIKVFSNGDKRLIIDLGNTDNVQALRIVSSLGQEVYYTEINQQRSTVILPQSISKGLYLATLFDSNKNSVLTKKIIIQ